MEGHELEAARHSAACSPLLVARHKNRLELVSLPGARRTIKDDVAGRRCHGKRYCFVPRRYDRFYSDLRQGLLHFGQGQSSSRVDLDP
jgi:hypothetical protein